MIHVEHLFTPSLFPDEFFHSGKRGFPDSGFPSAFGRDDLRERGIRQNDCAAE